MTGPILQYSLSLRPPLNGEGWSSILCTNPGALKVGSELLQLGTYDDRLDDFSPEGTNSFGGHEHQRKRETSLNEIVNKT